MLVTTSHVLLWIIVVIQGLCIFVLIQKVFQLHKIADTGSAGITDRLPRGTLGPAFEATDVRTGDVVKSSDWFGHDTVLLFLSTNCSTCKNIFEGLKTQADLTGLVIIIDGARRAISKIVPSDLSPTVHVLLSDELRVMSLYDVPFTPIAVELDGRSRIRSYRYPTKSEQVLDYLHPGMGEFSYESRDQGLVGTVLASASRES